MLENKREEIVFPLLPERQYVHSTTVLNYLTERFSTVSHIEFSFREFMFNPLIFEFSRNKPGKEAKAGSVAGGALSCEDKIWVALKNRAVNKDAVINEDQGDGGAEDYVRSHLMSGTDESSISPADGSGVTFWHAIVFGSKWHAKNTLDDARPRTLLLSGLDLDFPSEFQTITFRTRSRAPHRFARSHVLADSVPIGNINTVYLNA